MASNIDALTEKEKQTLRLIVRGHDAKSIARHLSLSVHTINERLRDVRRKMSVSSSKEAARRLLEQEGDTPKYHGDVLIGEAATPGDVQPIVGPETGDRRTHRFAFITIGVALMSLVLALAAVASLPQAMLPPVVGTPSANPSDTEVETTARQFLTLIDQSRWDDSYALTTESFHKLNTSQVWAQVS